MADDEPTVGSRILIREKQLKPNNNMAEVIETLCFEKETETWVGSVSILRLENGPLKAESQSRTKSLSISLTL